MQHTRKQKGAKSSRTTTPPQAAIEAMSEKEVVRLLRKTHRLKRRKVRKAKEHVDWWTDEEIALLGMKKDEEVAAMLGRKFSAVRTKREANGPQKRRRCSEPCRIKRLPKG
ncbi:MAG: hypothetical protein JWM16_5881 [Verrucomicrobiales bacterium]|nr:hypothetical protein [Verrucomicrobiales bacterium]